VGGGIGEWLQTHGYVRNAVESYPNIITPMCGQAGRENAIGRREVSTGG
jgi:hypothetical protein